MSSFGPQIEVAIARVRADVAKLHGELTRYGLVVWTGGNVSGRVPGAELFVIKPSGVSYDELAPENMILCDLDGRVVPGTPGSERASSSDTAAHAYVYRHMPEVGGVVHTHSTYATAWAARGEEIPCVITAMADEFGGPIPVGPFAIIGDDSIGRGIVDTLMGHRSRAVLMRNHGPFTIGSNARDAVKAAVMVEDVARTVHLAREAGPLVPIPQDAIDRLYDRYQNVYGQTGDARRTGAAGQAGDARRTGAAGQAGDARRTGTAGQTGDARRTGTAGQSGDARRGGADARPDTARPATDDRPGPRARTKVTDRR